MISNITIVFDLTVLRQEKKISGQPDVIFGMKGTQVMKRMQGHKFQVSILHKQRFISHLHWLIIHLLATV
jgi:phosphopantetheinyl transferase (holo-ACP synthase)